MEVKASHKLEVQQMHIILIGPSHSLASASRLNIEFLYILLVIISIYIGYLTWVYLAWNIRGGYFPTQVTTYLTMAARIAATIYSE
jgi:hypothetical protein